jgi:NADPH:quinone reductase-like Zn-dependent oxidoreductase
MRAVVFDRFGGPEVLEARDVADPAPRADEVLEFVRDGRLRPVVDVVLPLAEARRAHERIEAREVFGKVVLVP